MFFMGVILGVGVSAVIALAILVNMLWNGKSLGSVAQGTTPYPAVNDTIQPPQGQAPALKPVRAVDEKTDHIRGPKNAKVTLIEYSDFECPFCKRHAPSMAQALKDFPKDVRIVFRHYPLSFHQNAQKQAEASECVAKLAGNDAFWNFHDKIFERTASNGTGFANESLAPLAKEVGVKDEAAFKKCLDSGEMAGRVASDMASGNDSGVEGTPATFVNGQLISGAVPYETMKTSIQAAGAKQ